MIRECQWCEGEFKAKKTGRPQKYCCNACRQKAWKYKDLELIK